MDETTCTSQPAGRLNTTLEAYDYCVTDGDGSSDSGSTGNWRGGGGRGGGSTGSGGGGATGLGAAATAAASGNSAGETGGTSSVGGSGGATTNDGSSQPPDPSTVDDAVTDPTAGAPGNYDYDGFTGASGDYDSSQQQAPSTPLRSSTPGPGGGQALRPNASIPIAGRGAAGSIWA